MFTGKTGTTFRKCPNYLDIIPSEENPQEKRISQQIPQKDFLFKRSLIPQQGCSRLLSSEGVIPAPGLGQIVHRRIMHLPRSHLKGHQNFQLPFIPKRYSKVLQQDTRVLKEFPQSRVLKQDKRSSTITYCIAIVSLILSFVYIVHIVCSHLSICVYMFNILAHVFYTCKFVIVLFVSFDVCLCVVRN